MNKEQEKAAEKVRKALMAMGKVGLRGGVYETNFCIWPIAVEIEYDLDFFNNVKIHGDILFTPGVYLDGGAGV